MSNARTDGLVISGRSAGCGCLLVELEGVAFNSRRVAYDVLASIFADRDARLTTTLFAKHCVDTHPAAFAAPLLKSLKKERMSADKLIADLNEGVRLSLLDAGLQPAPGFRDLLEAARKQGLSIGVVSNLDDDTAHTLCEKAGLDPALTPLAANATPWEIAAPANPWRLLTRRLECETGACMALTTSHGACMAAIASTLWCGVLTDEFVAFHDFTGADLILDTLDAASADRLLAMAERT